MALPDPQNCSNSSLGMCRDLFHPCFTLFHQFGATRSAYGPKRPFLAVLDALGALWRTHMALPDQRNGFNASPGMCPDLFHPCSTLFHQFGATRSAYGRKRPFLAVLDPVWQPSGTPTWPSLTRETVTAKNYLKKYFSAATFLIHDKCVVLRVCAKLVDTYHCAMSFARC